MSLTSRQLRALSVAGLGAAALSGVAAGGAQAASKTLDYTCTYPLIGAQPLSVAIDVDLPSSVPAGTPSAQYAVTAKATAGEGTQAGLETIGAKTISGTATASAAIGSPDGDTALSVPTTIAPYTVQTGATSLTLDASGQTPSITVSTPGTATVKVNDLKLNLKAVDASGAPIDLGTTGDSDGDPNTFDVSCTLDAGQDNTLGTVTVS